MDLDLAALGRSALVGLATGSRSFSALAAQVTSTPPLASRQPESTLARPWAKGLVALAAAGELVGDKLPTAPSRLTPYVLAPRLVLAAVTTVLGVRADDDLARARHEPAAREQGPAEASLPPEPPATAVPAVAALAVPVAVGASLVSASLGVAWRRRAAKAFGADWPGAVLEDLVTLALAVLATRR
jgi:uncharacterized membrane protein